MEKLSMCRICLVENVRMCVVTNKSLQEIYEKLADVPFVSEDRKPMLACLFCCTRLKQCCQLQRKCVEAEELLAQMLSEDYEQKPLTNRGHLDFVDGFIITPIENISIVDDCHIESDAIKQEPPAVCEERDDVELELAHHSEELAPEKLYNSHPDVEAHHSESEPEEEQLVMQIKVEGDEHEVSECIRVRAMEKLELENLDKSNSGVEDLPTLASESDSEDDVPLNEISTQAEEGLEAPKRKRRACVTRRAAVAKKPTLKRKLEDTIPAKQTIDVLSDSKIIKTTESRAAVAKKPVLKRELEDTIPAKQTMNVLTDPKIIRTAKTRAVIAKKRTLKRNVENTFPPKQTMKVLSGSKIIRTTETNTSESFAKTKEPITTTSRSNFRKHSGEKPYQCDVCKRSFMQFSYLKNHSRVHVGEKPFKCNICPRSFSNKGVLKVHSRIHTSEKPYKCDICQQSFSLSSRLKQHIQIHTGKKPYKCDVCQHSFNRSYNLKIHSRVHTSEKPYKCDICQHSFSDRSNLTQHFRIHTADKPYKCDVCQRSFSHSTNLKLHIRAHTGEKPYKCDVCQRSFNRSGNLKIHVLAHTGEKPYKCDVCQQSFSLSSRLKQHFRIHTGEKPYKCDVCQRSFGQSSHLKQHIRIHSDEKLQI